MGTPIGTLKIEVYPIEQWMAFLISNCKKIEILTKLDLRKMDSKYHLFTLVIISYTKEKENISNNSRYCAPKK